MLLPQKFMDALQEGLIEFGMLNYDAGVNDTIEGLREGVEAYIQTPGSNELLASTLKIMMEAMKLAVEEKRKCRTKNQNSPTQPVH